MIKIYLRLLGFAKPFSRYAVPYFFYAALHALFNTFNYAMIIPILNAMFSEGFVFKPVYTMPALAFNEESLNAMLAFGYTKLFGEEFKMTYILVLLAAVLIVMNFVITAANKQRKAIESEEV